MIALLGFAREHGVNLDLLSTAWKINKKIRKAKDWEEIPFVTSGRLSFRKIGKGSKIKVRKRKV